MYNYDRSASVRKQALLSDGPVGRVLEREWNKLHDLEHDLKMTLRDYGDAAHFMGGPAQHDAEAVIKKIESTAKELEHLTMHTFNELVEAEGHFVKKYGEPSAYADKMRSETFPRSAAARQLLDPTKPTESNGVAFFYVGGGPNDGDPESINIHKGEVPVQAVVKYLHHRLQGSKAQPGHHGEVLVHFTDYSGKPASYTTPVKVEARK